MMIHGIRLITLLLSMQVFAAVSWANTETQTNQAALPNVVVILADDMGWNDVSYNGSEINTPNLDELANKGVKLDRFYVQPACSPTRASLMTAKNNQSLGIYSPISKIAPTGLSLNEKIMPEYFKDAGYQTALVGKWHLGFRQPGYRPASRGFDYFYGNLTGGIGYWDHVHGGGYDLQRNGKVAREEGYITQLQTAEIEKVIEQRDPSKPMFLYASFNAPHLPNEAPQKTIEKYQHIEDPLRQIHAAMVDELDQAIGRVINKLDEEGILENTLIWFMSDNGGLNISAMQPPIRMAAQVIDTLSFGHSDIPFFEFIRTNTLEGKASNLPFRGGKQSVYEGGTRVPSMLYWKGRLQPSVLLNMLTIQDVLPTLLHASQLPVLTNEVDGQSVWDVILDKPLGNDYSPTDFVTTGLNGQAYYQYPWKLLELNNGDIELYNLETDPIEANNLAESQTEKVTELSALLAQLPRAKSMHVPVYESFFEMDFFGGEETGAPWVEVFDEIP